MTLKTISKILIRVQIRSQKVPKIAYLFKADYHGRLFVDHLRLNLYFLKHFSDSCSVFQYSYFRYATCKCLRNLNFCPYKAHNACIAIVIDCKTFTKFHRVLY